MPTAELLRAIESMRENPPEIDFDEDQTAQIRRLAALSSAPAGVRTQAPEPRPARLEAMRAPTRG